METLTNMKMFVGSYFWTLKNQFVIWSLQSNLIDKIQWKKLRNTYEGNFIHDIFVVNHF